MSVLIQQYLAIHPLSVLRLVWKQKWIILAGWILCSVLGFWYARRLPNYYRAESLILVDPQKIPERFVESTVQVSLQDHLATISQQVLSATELQKLIDRFNLYPVERKTKPPEQIIDLARKELSISVVRQGIGVGSPGAFKVAYEGTNPVVVAGVVNHVSSLFIRENLRAREQQAEGTSAFLQGQLREARKELENQEAMFSQFKLERMGELPEQEAALLATLSRLQAQLQGNQDAISRAEQNRMLLENTLQNAEARYEELSSAVEQASNPEVSPGIGQTALAVRPEIVSETKPHSEVLAEELERARLRYLDGHPEIRRLKAEVENARRLEQAGQKAAPREARASASAAPAKPERTARRVSPALVAELNREKERVNSTRLQLQILKADIDRRTVENQKLQRSIQEYQGKVERIPLREQQMASITRDYDMSKENYRRLLDKKISAEMAQELEHRQQAERFTLQDPARVPGAPVKPKRGVIYGGCSFAGLVLSLVLALAAELRKNQFLGEWELPADVRVLGRVSTISGSAAAATRFGWFTR